MAWVNRVFALMPSMGVPVVNDTLFQSVGNALTTSQTTSLTALTPVFSQGYIRVKVYGGLTSPTIASLQVTVSDGTEFVTVFYSGVWATALSLSATAGGTSLATDGAMASASKVLTSASNPFTSAMVGAAISVSKAGNSGGTLQLYSTVASYQSAGQVTLANATVETGGTTGATVVLLEPYYGTGTATAPAGYDVLIPFLVDINVTRVDAVTTGAGTSFLDIEVSGTM